MFTLEYRPKKFSEVYGQDENVYILKSLVSSPNSYPRTLIFQGDWGCGKTTSARILARALNCRDRSNPEPCLQCDRCLDPLTYSPFYQELDSSTVGNKETMQSLKNDFFSSSAEDIWRVIVLDEAHLMSRSAQSSLLTILEELPKNIIVVLCTTDVKDLLNTIRSRSVELDFRTLREEMIVKNLQRIIELEGAEVPDSIVKGIARYSRGHVRDSVMALNMYCNVEEKDSFYSKIRSSEEEIIRILECIGTNSKGLGTLLEDLCRRPLEMVKDDFYLVLRNMMIVFGEGEVGETYFDQYKKLVSIWGRNSLTLFSLSLSDWAVNSFSSDITLQALFWSLKSRYSITQDSSKKTKSRFVKHT